MKNTFRTLFLVFVAVLAFSHHGYGQNKSYFDGKIILKYKSETRLNNIRSTIKADPKRQVQQVLQKIGATSVEPVWQSANHPAMISQSSAQLKREANNLSRIYRVSYTANTDAKVLATKLSKLPGVEYAEPLYIRYMQYTPNDPNDNPYQDYHRFEEAWDVTRGSDEVVIAIVDGGVNYLHSDLNDKLWINTDEVNLSVRSQVDENSDGTITAGEVVDYLVQNNGDFNNDGVFDLADALADGSPLLSGSDTDGNDFTDDIFGWDFWAGGGVNEPISADNDPLSDGTDHGAHVAGIATAETDNGEGIAGTGFNSRYMAVKAGGIPDDPSTEDDESRAIGFGYEGIIYAALEGADVINCSWGGGSFSAFENDVINFATGAGALVVAAAGNDAANTVDFPSAYEKVLSVGSVESNDQIASYSNIGYKVDVFGTGSGILSTGENNNLVSKSGTSMATPVAAGLAGLLKALHPEWGPLHIGAQIRSSAATLSGNNRLGHGKIDAFRAVTTGLPGVRVLSAEFKNPEGNKLDLNESGTLNLKLINYGRATSSLNLEVEPVNGQEISFNQPSQNIGALATGDSTTVSFDITINETFDLNMVPTVRVNLTDNSQSYRDFDIVQYTNILFDIVDANNIKTSFASDGTIGFTDPFTGRGGVGFIPRLSQDETFNDAENALFEGGLVMEASGTVFDAVRGASGQLNRDFEPLQTFSVDKNGEISAQDGRTQFTFSDPSGSSSGHITLETYAYNEPGLRNVVFVKYRITNTSTLPMNEMYVGLFNDWDIGEDISSNNISYSAQDSIMYVSTGNETGAIVAVAHIGEISSVLAINNFPETTPNNPSIDLSDGFSDGEKQAALKAGKVQTEISGADVSAVTATGPFTVNPEATVTVGYIYAFGNNVEELRSQIQNARREAPFAVSNTGLIIPESIPDETNLIQNFPNPFRDETTIRLDLAEDTDVKLTLYDVLGRKVAVIVDERLQAKKHFIPFNPSGLSSGIYYLRLQSDQKTKTIPITYIK